MEKYLSSIIIFVSLLISVPVLAKNTVSVLNHTGYSISILFTATGCARHVDNFAKHPHYEACSHVINLDPGDPPHQHVFKHDSNLNVHWTYYNASYSFKFGVSHGRYVICPDNSSHACKLIDSKNNKWQCPC